MWFTSVILSCYDHQIKGLFKFVVLKGNILQIDLGNAEVIITTCSNGSEKVLPKFCLELWDLLITLVSVSYPDNQSLLENVWLADLTSLTNVISVYNMVYILYIKIYFSAKNLFISLYMIIIFFNHFVTSFLMFLPSSAIIQTSDAVKFNMADKLFPSHVFRRLTNQETLFPSHVSWRWTNQETYCFLSMFPESG